MVSLPEISIRRPVFAWMMMIGIVVFGWIAFRQLGISDMPDVDYPVLTVTTSWPGAAPELIEAEIVDRLEQAIVSVDGIQEITSNIQQGVGTITIEFDISHNINTALQDVQSKISQVRLPLDAELPIVTKSNQEDGAIIWIGIKSTRARNDLIKYVDQNISDRIKKIPGVGQLQLAGFLERNLRLWVDSQKLKKYELTILDLKRAIETGHIEASAGKIENNDREFNIRIIGEGVTPEDVGEIMIDSRGGRPIYDKVIRVKDVARVEDGLSDVNSIVRVSGIPGVAIGITKQRGKNSVEIGRQVKETVKQISKNLPSDITLNIAHDGTEFIEESIAEAEFTLILSALATAIVCWLFLGSITPTANILISIPTSILGTFIVIKWMGFTLNFFTILGLTLAIGIVVDDAIMVLENIYRHRDMGKGKVRAALDGAKEITFATISSSVAVIAIFFPVAFVSGVLGKFIFQFAVTISCAVGFSLFESLTLTPMRCSQIMEKPNEEGFFARFLQGLYNALALYYRRILRFCLNWRTTVIILSIICFALSLRLIGTLRKEFVPVQDTNAFAIYIQSPVGSSLHFTDQKLIEVEEFIKHRREVARYVAISGGGNSNTGILYITLIPKETRTLSVQDLIGVFRSELSKIKDIQAFPVDYSASGIVSTGGAPVEFNIRGPNWTVLKEKTDEVNSKLKASGLVVDINDSFRSEMPEVRVLPIREIAAERGVSIDAIGQTISAAIGGIRVGKFTRDGHRYDLRIRLSPEERLLPDDILKLSVRNSYGELMQLSQMIKIETISSLQSITRIDRERSISITANLAPGKSQGEAISEVQRVGAEVLSGDYHLYLANSARSFIESIDSLIYVLYLGIFISYMVLASQFNSFIHPFIVLIALPFSLTGALIALHLGNQSINFYSMIGILLLMGITKKNSILLVDFTNTLRKQNNITLSVNDALLFAAPVRLRPILMTTFATLAAALPPALAIGPGSESRIPMSIAILGGIIVSTLFTLIVVPCAYSLLAGLEKDKTSDEETEILNISKDLEELHSYRAHSSNSTQVN